MILLVSSAVKANNLQVSVVHEPYFSLMLHVSSYKPAPIHAPSPFRIQADRASPLVDMAFSWYKYGMPLKLLFGAGTYYTLSPFANQSMSHGQP